MGERPHRLLFVCSGNICRSPLAEVLAIAHAERSGVSLEARSAGTLGLVDREAEPGMVTVGREVGVDLTAHRSQAVSEELVAWADRILVMEYVHHGFIVEAWPEHLKKVEMLGRYADLDEIADPIGAWFTFRYRSCRKQLQTAVTRLIDKLPLAHEG